MLGLNLSWNRSHTSYHCIQRSRAQHLPPSPPQEAAENNEVTPQPLSLQVRQAQGPQLLLTGLASSPVTTFVALLWYIQGSSQPSLNSGSRPAHSAQGEADAVGNPLSWLAGCALLDAPQDEVCPWGCQGTRWLTRSCC